MTNSRLGRNPLFNFNLIIYYAISFILQIITKVFFFLTVHSAEVTVIQSKRIILLTEMKKENATQKLRYGDKTGLSVKKSLK